MEADDDRTHSLVTACFDRLDDFSSVWVHSWGWYSTARDR
jgi:hypothetical protein